MSIEAVGAFTVLIGLLAIWRGPAFAFAAFVPLTLFGAAAAILLGGSGSIQPAHLMLGFVALAAVMRLDLTCLREPMRFPREGFWLIAFTVVSVGGAILLPRLLAQTTNINAVGSTDYGPSVSLVPLGPTSGNMTQSIYGVADMLCFLLCLAFASRPGGFRHLARTLVAYCCLNIAFALIDLATFWTNTGFLLAPIRNADYQLHIDTAVTGLKRIVGTFTETSSFSYVTLGALGFSAELWLAGLRPRLFGPIALISLVLLALSTSSTAYVATPVLLAALYGRTLLAMLSRRATAAGMTMLIIAPIAVVAVTAGILLEPAARASVTDTLTAFLFDKASSQSAIERASWNAAAIQNVIDTDGLGAGLGSVRASSFPVAVVANTGIPGLILLSIFMLRLFLFPAASNIGGPAVVAVRGAARMACLGLLLGATVSGAMVDLGLAFFIFAALACATPVRESASVLASARAPRLTCARSNFAARPPAVASVSAFHVSSPRDH